MLYQSLSKLLVLVVMKAAEKPTQKSVKSTTPAKPGLPEQKASKTAKSVTTSSPSTKPTTASPSSAPPPKTTAPPGATKSSAPPPKKPILKNKSKAATNAAPVSTPASPGPGKDDKSIKPSAGQPQHIDPQQKSKFKVKMENRKVAKQQKEKEKADAVQIKKVTRANTEANRKVAIKEGDSKASRKRSKAARVSSASPKSKSKKNVKYKEKVQVFHERSGKDGERKKSIRSERLVNRSGASLGKK